MFLNRLAESFSRRSDTTAESTEPALPAPSPDALAEHAAPAWGSHLTDAQDFAPSEAAVPHLAVLSPARTVPYRRSADLPGWSDPLIMSRDMANLDAARLGHVANRAPVRAPAHADGPTWGMEMELAARDPAMVWAKATEVPGEAYASMLEAVNRALGPDAGAIVINEKPNGTREAQLIDRLGREWKAVPEYLDSVYRQNGFELVGPPLRAQDVPLMERVRAELDRDFTAGVRSSTHNTFEVSHLVGADGDASRLVHLILGIESHWPEIYGALAPQRYGTIVNRFSIPMSVNQRELLEDLAGLPQPHIDQVKAIFDRYRERETQLIARAKDNPFKYRAANYGKLFPEEGGARLLEFRVSDLLKPEEIGRTQQLLQSLVTHGADLPRPLAFRSPFPESDRNLVIDTDPNRATEQLQHLNDVVTQLPGARYVRFLERLGLDPVQYPQETSLFENPVRFNEAELRTLLGTVPLHERIEVKGGHLSFGFEAEFKAQPGQTVVRGPFNRANRSAFPFLDRYVHKEHTGNVEIRSVPCETLGELFEQMHAVRADLGKGLRGFHCTVQLPKEQVDEIGHPEFAGWLLRVGDLAHAWRVENRSTFFSMKTWSQRRPGPNTMMHPQGRATLRAYDLKNGRFRIETRGYMSSVEGIERSILKMVAGLRTPSLVRGFPVEQNALTQVHPALQLASVMRSIKGADLSADEQAKLDMMLRGAEDKPTLETYGHLLPMVGFETAPYLTPAERTVFRNATQRFYESAFRLMQRTDLGDAKSYESRLRRLVATWAEDTHLYQVLDQSILCRPSVAAPATAGMVSKVAGSGQRGLGPWMAQLSAEQNLPDILGAVETPALERLHHAVVAPSEYQNPGLLQLDAELARRGIHLAPVHPPAPPAAAAQPEPEVAAATPDELAPEARERGSFWSRVRERRAHTGAHRA